MANARAGVRGVEAMRAKLAGVGNDLLRRTGAALRQELEIEATEIKKRTPVDTGALRASIHVEGPDYRGNTVTCSVVAGGVAAPYAQVVHEDLDAFHPVGQAKYMEATLDESAPHMAARVAKRAGFQK